MIRPRVACLAALLVACDPSPGPSSDAGASDATARTPDALDVADIADVIPVMDRPDVTDTADNPDTTDTSDVIDVTDVIDVIDVTDVADSSVSPDASDVHVVTTELGATPLPAMMSDAPLRLIAPLSTAVVTSRRPTLRWGPLADGDTTRLELCADAECTRPIETLDVAGSSARPSAPLPPGAVFWRARVTRREAPAWASPTWEFFVTPHDSDVDTTRCCVDDVNRDGRPDLLFSGGAVIVSNRAGYESVPWRVTDCAAPVDTWCTALGGGYYLGSSGSVMYPGDVDGDGFGDYALAGRGLSTALQFIADFGTDYDGDGRYDVGFLTADVTSATATFITASTTRTLRWEGLPYDRDIRSTQLEEFWTVGDLDGDGYEELRVAFSPPLWGAPPVRALLRGGPDAYRSERSLDLSRGVASDLFDVNGDGFHDRLSVDSDGRTSLYLGGPAGFSRAAPLPHCDVASAACRALSFFSPGDFDRDGLSDLYVFDSDARTLEVYPGGATGFAASPVLTTTLAL